MIQRRTPIKRSPLKRSNYRLRRTPLKRTGRKVAREAAALDEFRRVLVARSKGWCESRTPACSSGRHAGSDSHHLEPADRDRGLHDPERGLYLCRPGHRWVHANPALAKRRGLLHPDT